jgi:hypothetical protein
MVIRRNESVAFGPEQSLDICRIAGIAFENEIRTPRQGIVFHGGPDPRDAARDGRRRSAADGESTESGSPA